MTAIFFAFLLAAPNEMQPASDDAASFSSVALASADAADPASSLPVVPPAASAVTEPATAFPARVYEHTSPLVFHLPLLGKDARHRAQDASEAFAAALQAKPKDGAPAVSVVVGSNTAVVRVHGRAIATLTSDDAAAEGSSDLRHYADELETRLLPFVEEELQRSSLQEIALHIFLSVLFSVLGVLTLRALRAAALRIEHVLEERRSHHVLKIFGMPVISGEALRGTLLVALFVGRLLSYVVVTLVVIGAIMGQFDATRPLPGLMAKAALGPIVAGMDTLIGALPGVLLAALILVAAAAALRFSRLLLDGVAQGQIEGRLIDPARVPATRAVITTVVVVVATPLMIAAAFGRFGTPLEGVATGLGAVVLIAAIPVLANAAVGVFVLWTGHVRPGEWIRIGTANGEVTAVNLVDTVLVPEDGGTVRVPMLLLALHPLARITPPRKELALAVQRDRPWPQLEAKLLASAKSVHADATVSVAALSKDSVHCVLSVPLGKPDAVSLLATAALEAAERDDFKLMD